MWTVCKSTVDKATLKIEVILSLLCNLQIQTSWLSFLLLRAQNCMTWHERECVVLHSVYKFSNFDVQMGKTGTESITPKTTWNKNSRALPTEFEPLPQTKFYSLGRKQQRVNERRGTCSFPFSLPLLPPYPSPVYACNAGYRFCDRVVGRKRMTGDELHKNW